MRDELMEQANQKAVFATLAARAIEEILPPTSVPDDGVVRLERLGLRVTVPSDALGKDSTGPDGDSMPLFSMSTLAPQRIAYLSESEKRKRGEFCFSPVVSCASLPRNRTISFAKLLLCDHESSRLSAADAFCLCTAANAKPAHSNLHWQVQIDYPANANSDDPPVAFAFETPLVLEMPHCFQVDADGEGTESLVMLGAPHGTDQWQMLDAMSTKDMSPAVEVVEGVLRVKVPYAGIFCAFSSPDIEDIALTRLKVYALPDVPCDAPTTIRVHLSNDLPDVQQELDICENSECAIHSEA